MATYQHKLIEFAQGKDYCAFPTQSGAEPTPSATPAAHLSPGPSMPSRTQTLNATTS
jgi:hypothetical protein